MNGPEKLLLMTAPVNLRVSGYLHGFGFLASIGLFCFNQSRLDLPNWSMLVRPAIITFLVVFALPMLISILHLRHTQKEYRSYTLNKQRGKKEN